MLQPRISKEKQEHLPTSVETVLNCHCASEQQHLSLVCFRPPFDWLLFFFFLGKLPFLLLLNSLSLITNCVPNVTVGVNSASCGSAEL